MTRSGSERGGRLPGGAAAYDGGEAVDSAQQRVDSGGTSQEETQLWRYLPARQLLSKTHHNAGGGRSDVRLKWNGSPGFRIRTMATRSGFARAFNIRHAKWPDTFGESAARLRGRGGSVVTEEVANAFASSLPTKRTAKTWNYSSQMDSVYPPAVLVDIPREDYAPFLSDPSKMKVPLEDAFTPSDVQIFLAGATLSNRP